MPEIAEPPREWLSVRPSTKLLLAGYVLCLVAAGGIVSYWQVAEPAPKIEMWWPLMLPAIALLLLVRRHIARVSTRLSVVGDRLRYESGLLSKTQRTMELHKVQDVRVDQTIGQRVLRIGNLSVETAGDSSRIEIRNIDSPQEVAERILDLAHPKGK